MGSPRLRTSEEKETRAIRAESIDPRSFDSVNPFRPVEHDCGLVRLGWGSAWSLRGEVVAPSRCAVDKKVTQPCPRK